jgi:hypothetical protein
LNILHNGNPPKLTRGEINAWEAERRHLDGTFRPSPGRPPIRLDDAGQKKTIKQLIDDGKATAAARTMRDRHERGWPDAAVISTPPLPHGHYFGMV